MWDVIIIGAGLSGLVAARQLAAAGLRVVVVEKSRGLGGRLATRRVEGTIVDHGCGYLAASAVTPSPLIAELAQAGVLTRWAPTRLRLDHQGQLQSALAGSHAPFLYQQGFLADQSSGALTHYVCPQGMNTLAKTLAQGLTIHRQCRVTHLEADATGWVVRGASLNPGESGQPLSPPVFNARAVLLAIPAPQILPILAPTSAQLPSLAPGLASLEQVQYEAVITVMAGYSQLTSEGWLPLSPPDQGWMVLGDARSSLRWVGLDSSKRPQPAPPVVVMHSSAAFAETYLNAASLTVAGEQLLGAAADSLTPALATPDWWQVHRWRYGLVRKPVDSAMVRLDAPFPLVCCGDWCQELSNLGDCPPNHLTVAQHSGHRAAAWLIQALPRVG
jgi:renalase